jgi:hypothetical protein
MPHIQIQFRRDTSVSWTFANPVLASGELGIELDTKKFKIGDGTTAWNSLPYLINNDALKNTIVIGESAGQTGQGSNSIAIGSLAGLSNQSANSIAINASGLTLFATGANSCFISPIRSATFTNVLGYDTTNSEVVYASKTFVIDHPTKQDKYLVHACLEGPEAGIYYRGKDEIINGEYKEITLPEYAKHIAKNFNVSVTPIYNGSIKDLNVSEVEDGKFRVYGGNCKFFWTVIGERLKINVEPNKNDCELRGEGPYTYLV